jgi:hypothetical protein
VQSGMAATACTGVVVCRWLWLWLALSARRALSACMRQGGPRERLAADGVGNTNEWGRHLDVPMRKVSRMNSKGATTRRRLVAHRLRHATRTVLSQNTAASCCTYLSGHSIVK